MKYITTDKHPELKEGLIIDGIEKGSYLVFTNEGIYVEIHKEKSIEKGYIKEVEEKEYIESEVKDFAVYYNEHTTSLGMSFTDWVRQRNKK